MRLIRLTVIGLALATVTASTIQAQEDRPAGRRESGKRAMQILLTDIKLDSAQTVKVDALMAKYRTQMQSLRKDDGSRDEAARKKMGELIDKQKAAVRALLTPKQQALFDRNAAKLSERRSGRGDGSYQATNSER